MLYSKVHKIHSLKPSIQCILMFFFILYTFFIIWYVFCHYLINNNIAHYVVHMRMNNTAPQNHIYVLNKIKVAKINMLISMNKSYSFSTIYKNKKIHRHTHVLLLIRSPVSQHYLSLRNYPNIPKLFIK